MRIIFMGSPDFAVASLDALVNAGHEIVAVISQGDKIRGRNKEICPTPVKAYGLSHGLPCFTPTEVKSREFLDFIKGLQADIIVVAAYGKILPKAMLEACSQGAINVHGSLLPAYRGPSPIYQAILNGEKETGITTMYMAEGLDAGDICLQAPYKLDEAKNFGEVYDGLSKLGGTLLLETLALLAEGKAPRISQDESKATYTRLLTREDEAIDWLQPGAAIGRKIRALAPEPGAYTLFDAKPVKLLDAAFVPEEGGGDPGAILACDNQSGLKVGVKDGFLLIRSVKPQGKKEMAAADWFRGIRDKENPCFFRI